MIWGPGSEYSFYGGYADDLFLLVVFLLLMVRILFSQGVKALTALSQLLKLLLKDIRTWYMAR